MLISVMQLRCQFCEALSDAFDGAIWTPKDLREELKQEGWRRRRTQAGTVDECPDCAKAATGKKAA